MWDITSNSRSQETLASTLLTLSFACSEQSQLPCCERPYRETHVVGTEGASSQQPTVSPQSTSIGVTWDGDWGLMCCGLAIETTDGLWVAPSPSIHQDDLYKSPT